jgi:hypothetical protein
VEEASRAVPARSGAPDLSTAREGAGAPTVCLNCGTSVERHFCPECGQRAIDPNPTLREFAHEAAEGFLNWDGKLIGTLRLLVTSPGALTREYLAGRRVTFISPLRVYLTCSFLFFFIKALLPDAPIQVNTTSASAGGGTASRKTGVQIGIVAVQDEDESKSISALDELGKQRGVAGEFYRHFARALRDKGKLSAAMTSNIPRMMFVLLPLYAAMVALVFRRRRMRYPQHLAFALHVHAFLFLALLLTLITRVVKNGPIPALFVATSFALIAGHLVLATRRVYETGTWEAIARSALVAAAYFVAFVAAMATLFLTVVFFNF